MFEFSFAASISDKLIVSKQLSMIMIFMSLWPADGQNLVDEKTIKRECWMLESEETKKYMDKEFIIHVVDITLVSVGVACLFQVINWRDIVKQNCWTCWYYCSLSYSALVLEYSCSSTFKPCVIPEIWSLLTLKACHYGLVQRNKDWTCQCYCLQFLLMLWPGPLELLNA